MSTPRRHIAIVSQSPDADRLADELRALGYTVALRWFPLDTADAGAGLIVLDRGALLAWATLTGPQVAQLDGAVFQTFESSLSRVTGAEIAAGYQRAHPDTT